MKRTIHLILTLLRINIQQELAYRADALVNILLLVMWTAWDLTGLAIIFSNTNALGGWQVAEMVVLLGVFRFINAFMAAIIWPNTEKFNSGLRDGSLDYTLLQPAPSLLLITFSRIVIWRGFDLVIALSLVAAGVWMSGGGATPLALASFVLLVAGGMLIFYSLWIVMIAVTFWFIKFDNNVTILQALLEAGRYPATVYPVWLRMIVTFVVPIAVATTVPVQALRGELAGWQVGLFLAVAVAAVVVSLRIWRVGVRRYAGASS